VVYAKAALVLVFLPDDFVRGLTIDRLPGKLGFGLTGAAVLGLSALQLEGQMRRAILALLPEPDRAFLGSQLRRIFENL
jgi:hypothetical protein